MKIFIASVSAGAGHIRAGEALRKWGEKIPEVSLIEHQDVLKFSPSAYKEFYAGSYLKMADSIPELWGYIFWHSDRKKTDIGEKCLRLVNRLNTKKFRDYVLDKNFDITIATHFLPAEVLLRKKRQNKYNGKIYVVVTDYGPHRFWVMEDVDGYFAATQQVKEELVLRGLEKDKIFVTGIPVMPEFSEKIDRKALYSELGFSENIPILLVMSIGHGSGGTSKSVAAALSFNRDIQVIFICGRNTKMQKELEKIKFSHNVKPRFFGFVNDVWKYMEIADILLTKPGGLTVSEALAKNLPMIIINPVPGQEELNSDFLLENGLAVKATSIYSLKIKLRRLLSDKNLLNKMKSAAKLQASPFAGRDIISKVLEK
ncbi:MAG: glycosyltransferase [Planctomycetota bacterium]